MSRSGKGQSLLWEQDWAAQRLHAPIACWFSKDMRKRTAHLQGKELNPQISLFTCSTQECHGILIAVNGWFELWCIVDMPCRCALAHCSNCMLVLQGNNPLEQFLHTWWHWLTNRPLDDPWVKNEHFHLQNTPCANVWTGAKGSNRIALMILGFSTLVLICLLKNFSAPPPRHGTEHILYSVITWVSVINLHYQPKMWDYVFSISFDPPANYPPRGTFALLSSVRGCISINELL